MKYISNIISKANRAEGLSTVDNLEATIGISAFSPQRAKKYKLEKPDQSIRQLTYLCQNGVGCFIFVVST